MQWVIYDWFIQSIIIHTRSIAEEAGVKAFCILKTFQAVFAACPVVANTCSVASLALSPNQPNLIYQIQL